LSLDFPKHGMIICSEGCSCLCQIWAVCKEDRLVMFKDEATLAARSRTRASAWRADKMAGEEAEMRTLNDQFILPQNYIICCWIFSFFFLYRAMGNGGQPTAFSCSSSFALRLLSIACGDLHHCDSLLALVEIRASVPIDNALFSRLSNRDWKSRI
jgi:hypothetical protein